MSDFLSNFDNNNYKKTINEKKTRKKEKSEKLNEDSSEYDSLENLSRYDEHKHDSENIGLPLNEELVKKEKRKKKKRKKSKDSQHDFVEGDDLVDHDVEIDPHYKKKQQKKYLLIGGVIATSLLIFYLIYYQATRVKVPDFSGKTVVDARNWASENKIQSEVEQEYSIKVDSNSIISQSVAPDKKIKKGSKMMFKVSEGADPKQKIDLPDFQKMSKSEVEQWIKKNKAENVTIIEEYDDKIEKNKFIKLEFTDKEVNKDNYLRQDIANVYFSKGKEVFEKNISVPDFSKKAKTDVEDWAKKNDIKVEFKEVDSDKIETGLVVSQTVAPETKIAKHDSMGVSISVGKAVIVPNFANYSAEEAANVSADLQVMARETFSDTIPFGQLISQSVEAGKKLTGDDDKIINLTYSSGRPYIKSFFGQLEGDIPKLIYDNFNSKGAAVTYEVYYVDSDKEKGQIVNANVYNQYIATNAHLVFAISNGKYASLPSEPAQSENE